MIQSYKKKPTLQEKYDTIIIGSGMGGLATAAILAKEGQKVLVLERHYTAGGFTHIFKRKGYEWDVGIHYIGDVQRDKSILKKLFDYVSNGDLKWEDMGDVYDKIIIGNKQYDFVKGVRNFKKQMITYFPEEEQAINKYVDTVFEAVKASKNYYISKTLSTIPNAIAGGFLRKPFYKYSDKTTYEVLREITDNEELIKVLTGQYGDYGLPPKQSSFSMHASVARHYFDGGSYPIGGSSQIVKTIDPVIEAGGGTILVSAEVDEVLINKGKAIGVQMKDGKQILAKNIISNAGLITTYNKLLPTSIVKKYQLKKHLQTVNPSVAHVSLYIGLEGTPEELQIPKTNYWVYPAKGDHDTCVHNYLEDLSKPFPVVYMSFPAAKDPDWKNRYPGKSAIDIITLVPYEMFEKWKETSWKKRGDDYEEIKEQIAQRLLKELYKQLPQVEGKIKHYELSSPLTTEHFVNYQKGEIYGLDHSPSRFRQPFLKPKTPIKNFYLTGQDIVTAGIGGALFSGVLSATAVTGKNLLKKVL
ncbi:MULTISPECIES: phytoene desaturase family protein [unclassified Tenacibaculum]|uniref:phytoene desaturase family protein n=1 Tax=unclassified Tenacibaculum TaxID=2635139 RepID=UPI001F2F4DF4|nr:MULTISPECIES: NAD(P)/FAD-dependent oxidoreductase [unclassified Tenacibaculum]MCF2876471.1 NAD(P)/FAD-dependent oxidoreductase [Tenacibaculum sp. Cn5-1]MCF2936622.1 NAD(P)/FAD-dependent oxidoreductase [Tenacibaculum sp. Cn5-34]MCG7511785.1 NAD(P)/FAD-dependent oxidoreductase [Tenacibaculum sp. Cn5-46]